MPRITPNSIKHLPETEKVFLELWRNVEDVQDGWGMVYLDNCSLNGLTKHMWAGQLATLESKGLYRPAGIAFGEVRDLTP